MLKIGLTGGIGSGKTTVCKHFMQRGVPVIDADEIAHALVQPGQPALGEITDVFGTKLLQQDGSLNRKMLRNLVFSSPEQKRKLESILHPRVFSEITHQLNLLDSAYAILAIPLLIETHSENFVDRILVIDCSREQQIARISKRDRLSKQLIQAIIESQVSRDQRIRGADDIIDNSGSESKLAAQIKKLHNLYLTLSTAQEK